MMTDKPMLQNLIYAVILAIAGITFYLLRPTYSYTPHGLFLPAKVPQVTPISPESVSIQMNNPANQHPLGMLSVFTHFDATDEAEMNRIIQDQIVWMKNEAAEHGGKTVVVTLSGRSPGAPNPLDGVVSNALVYQ